MNKTYSCRHCPAQAPAKVCQTAIPDQMPWPAWNCTGAVSLFASLSPGMTPELLHFKMFFSRHLKV